MNVEQSVRPPNCRGESQRIGVCSWSLRPASPAELVEALTRLDIEAVQLDLSRAIDQPNEWGRAPAELRGRGILVVSGMMRTAGEDYSTLETIRQTGGVRPDSTWARNQQHAEAVAHVAAREGIELVTFHAGFIPEHADDPERAKLIERLRTIADIFASHGITIAFETGQETADVLLEVLAEINRPGAQLPGVGVNFDPANMILYGMGDPVASLRKLAPHVKQVHIKDALPTQTPGTWGKEVAVGRGAVDWPAFFAVANAITPPVNYIIEREAGEGREPDIAAARDLIARHV